MAFFSWFIHLLPVLFHCIGLSSPVFVGKRISAIGGPFRTVVERFEACCDGAGAGAEAGAGYTGTVLLSVSRVSRQGVLPARQRQRVTGNLTLLQELDDSMTMSLRIDKWSDNQWKRNAFIIRLAELCSLMRGAGILGDASCPATQGVYRFKDLETDWRVPMIPEFHYGRWRAEVVFGQEQKQEGQGGARGARGAPLGCVRFLFQTSPAVAYD